MSFGPSFPFRVGDVVRFARGANEYGGTIKYVSPTLMYLRIESEHLGDIRVVRSHVLALDRPVMTDKEYDAVRALLELGPLTVAEAKEAMLPLTGTVMRNLRDRGLVSPQRFGVTSLSVFSWQLTEEGERVAEQVRP